MASNLRWNHTFRDFFPSHYARLESGHVVGTLKVGLTVDEIKGPLNTSREKKKVGQAPQKEGGALKQKIKIKRLTSWTLEKKNALFLPRCSVSGYSHLVA